MIARQRIGQHGVLVQRIVSGRRRDEKKTETERLQAGSEINVFEQFRPTPRGYVPCKMGSSLVTGNMVTSNFLDVRLGVDW